jgi:Ca-activated chloride channel family protein
MTFLLPLMLVVAVGVTGASVAAYLFVLRRRSEAWRASGFGLSSPSRRVAFRQHVPYALFLAALPLLLVGLARPQAQVAVPHVAGTVILVFDVSNSMAADDVKPTRLAAAQAIATNFVQAQPDTVDIGVVIFGQDGLATQRPTADRRAVLAAIARMKTSGGTSLSRAILASLSTIVGRPVQLPEGDAADQPTDLGYWGSATIVLFSDGQDMAQSTEGVEAAAGLAAAAGVRIETVGMGTTQGTTVQVDGYQVATALNEDLLTNIAATTGGSYHPAQDAAALKDVHRSIDLRLSTKPQPVELTAPFAGAALLLLTLGGLLMIRWHGRII